MVSFHIEIEALVWYQDALNSSQLFSGWKLFVKALQVCVGPSAFVGLMEALTCLK